MPPDPLPEIFFGGSSAAAGPVAAEPADVYLTWGEPPHQVKEKIDWIRPPAEERGRTVRFRAPREEEPVPHPGAAPPVGPSASGREDPRAATGWWKRERTR